VDINEQIARRIAQLRDERGLSIDELAVRSEVSRAMIYRIENGKSSPTAVVLNKIATGLGVLLPTLLGPGSYREARLQLRNPVSTKRSQVQWQDPQTGYRRRTLTPATSGQSMQLSEIRFPAGAKVTFENSFGAVQVHQQIWMLSGLMELRLGKETAHLGAGDCMAMTLDQPISFHNPGKTEARYLVAVVRAGK